MLVAHLPGWIKINCDASVSLSGAVGLACCARDSFGALVYALAKFLVVYLSVLVVEFVVVIMGLVLADSWLILCDH